MANLFSTIRGKVPSKRAMLALGGAAALALVGVVQTAGTMAGSTDNATAQVSQIASQNFTPVPVIASAKCGGHAYNGSVTISWDSVGPGYWYELEAWRYGASSPYITAKFTSATSYSLGEIENGTLRTTTNVRIYTRYMSQTGERSTGYGVIVVNRQSGPTYCDGGSWGLPGYQTGWDGRFGISAWQQTADWTPGTANKTTGDGGLVESPLRKGIPEAEKQESTEAPSSSPEPSASEAPSSTETPPSSEAPSTSETPSSSETESPSASVPPTSTPDESKSEPKVTIAIKVDGDTRTLGVFHNGEETPVCTVPLADGDEPAVGNNKVSIVNGDAVYEVDPHTCAKS